MFDFLWDFHQQRRLGNLESGQRQSDSTAERAMSQAESVQERLERLELACAAMWELLKETGLSEQQLLDRMQALDVGDGRADGRLRRQAQTCPACRRLSGRARTTCVYCGATLPPGPVFGAR